MTGILSCSNERPCTDGGSTVFPVVRTTRPQHNTVRAVSPPAVLTLPVNATGRHPHKSESNCPLAVAIVRTSAVTKSHLRNNEPKIN
jgi:hypothetical protein